MEAVPHLRRGIVALRQYAERHGVPDELIRRAEARHRSRHA
ncbi:MAG TPA: hypothetical protein VEO00_12575 [Actinomycetota bacterium]|nr:hypothetical protein [Actinomycetota bacterium]